ncbi:helix-turn-helix transcriptional regulator [Pseudoalteromonas sp. S16_S37]|uniref:helix-turn-helix transcriptional regulator n=1 Tax=Pseudoalteromonas sp. S16_S37 TaxID=2720228 RepID=UPI0016806478|nr:WYL domain-containing protein [Pseudoalteromonas sp. S16_S37]MBD1581969.1 WYL domain-containing protein [Pseudoalteromonas sp. S16_S37]
MATKEDDYFRYFEALLLWEGQIQTGLFQHKFGLSRPSASKYLNRFIDEQALDLYYDESEKAHCLASPFTPQLISENFTEYTQRVAEPHVHQLTQNHLSVLPLPNRKLEPQLLRPILTACRKLSALDIRYQSIKHNSETERIIRPHSLVNTGLRFHLRAYCEASDSYRDFSLSRILSAELDYKCKAKMSQQDDVSWQTPVELVIMPDPRLSHYAQQVIARDFNMQNQRATIVTNAALINYLISILRLDFQHPNPEAQQIVIVPECYRELSARGHLWNG